MNKIKQRLGKAGIILAILLIVGGSLYAFSMTRNEAEPEQERMQPERTNQFSGMDEMITASGTTAIGMDAVAFEIDFLEETSLYVEEIYYAKGDMVEAGEMLLKLTEESVASAREELQNTAKEAELSYRSSVITTNQSKIQAKYTYETALLEANQAEQVYNDTIAQLQESVDQAQQSYNEALEAYNELYNAIQNNTLRSDYEVDEKKTAYQEAYDLYVTKLDYWEISDEEMASNFSNNTSSTAMASQGTVGTQGAGGMQGAKGVDKEAMEAQADRNWILKTVQLLKEESEEMYEEYQKAEEDYADALENAELDIQLLFNKLETSREDLEDANLNFKKGSSSAKMEYELAKATQGTAKNDYDATITALEKDLEQLKDAKEEADANLTLFEELVGDGYIYTTEEGTILTINATEGQALSGDDMLFAYSNPAEITVSVSVSQDDIAELSVGDTTTVMISEAGNYTGTITTINPIASSDSRTAVSYTVQISLEGDMTGMEANQSATVIFGEMSMPENMEKPERMERPFDMGEEHQSKKGAENE